EHVASHDGGADVGERLLDDFRALVDLAAFHPMHPAPRRERKHPLVEPQAADAERVVHALVRPGDEAVERHRDPETQLRHAQAGARAGVFARLVLNMSRWMRQPPATCFHTTMYLPRSKVEPSSRRRV